jgi:C-terminal processing protease CtpA/Prc
VRTIPGIFQFALMATVLAATAAIAGEKGWFGFALAVDVTGTPLNPKLHTVKVDSVIAASPAAAAGIAPGDLFVEIEGISVEGANAYAVKAAMQKSVGETLHLKVKHGTDAPHDAALIAVPKPAK